MAVLIRSGNSDGERRCDGRCHKAEHGKCTCICGGRYHGVAVDRAGPRDIVEAELLVQGVDPSQVSLDELWRIRQQVVERCFGFMAVGLDLFGGKDGS